MDEYLFNIVAKLKADRLKLEHESRNAVPEPAEGDKPVHRSPSARRSRAEFGDLSAIVPAHGLRGWS